MIVLLGLLMVALSPLCSVAQPVLKTTVIGGSYVTVTEQSGWIDHRAAEGRLSFQNKSFVTFAVGDSIYTNSDKPPIGTLTLPAAITTQSGDTIICEWTVPGAILRQTVRPQMTTNGLKWATVLSSLNTSDTVAVIKAQYLLDLQILGEDGIDHVLPWTGQHSGWTLFNDSIPAHAVFTQYTLPNAPTYDPGVIAIAQFRDEDFGFNTPSKLIFGHWPQLERYPFYDPSLVDTVEIANDAAFIAQWDSAVLASGDSAELGGFAYGKAQYKLCAGERITFVLAPESIPLTTVTRIPIYMFTPDPELRTSKLLIRAEATGGLRFGSGNTFYSLSLPLLDKDHVGYAELPVTSVSLAGSLGGNVSLRSPSHPLTMQDCELSIRRRTGVIDSNGPRISVARQLPDCHSRSDTITIADDKPYVDEGIADVDIEVSNYHVTSIGSNVKPALSERYAFATIDSMFDATATIRARDMAGNMREHWLEYCTTPDVRKPVEYSLFERTRWAIHITDSQAWDRGLSHIEITNALNIVVQDSSVVDRRALTVYVWIEDTTRQSQFCYVAVDVAGNRTIQFCTSWRPTLDVLSAAIPSVSLWPNPVSDLLNVRVGDDLAEACIFDLLGNTVWSGELRGEGMIDVSSLPAGSYYFRLAAMTGGVRTLRVTKN